MHTENEPPRPELSKMLAQSEDKCPKLAAGGRRLPEVQGQFLLVLGPASDPHVGCRLELTLPAEKHLVSPRTAHSWSATYPRFKHNIRALICCQEYYTRLKAWAPRSVLKLSGPSLHIIWKRTGIGLDIRLHLMETLL